MPRNETKPHSLTHIRQHGMKAKSCRREVLKKPVIYLEWKVERELRADGCICQESVGGSVPKGRRAEQEVSLLPFFFVNCQVLSLQGQSEKNGLQFVIQLSTNVRSHFINLFCNTIFNSNFAAKTIISCPTSRPDISGI